VQRLIWLKGDLNLRLSKFKLSKNLGSGGEKCGNTHLGFSLDQQLGKQRGKVDLSPLVNHLSTHARSILHLPFLILQATERGHGGERVWKRAYRAKRGGQGRLNHEGRGETRGRRRVTIDCNSISIHLVRSFFDPMNHHDPNSEYNILVKRNALNEIYASMVFDRPS